MVQAIVVWHTERSTYTQRKNEFFVEGLEKEVEPKGSVGKILKQIKDAIEQACYYTGEKRRNIQELRESEIIFLSNGSMKESYAR